MIIKIALVLFFSALACLMLGDLLNHLYLRALANVLMPLGDAVLLLSFSLLLLVLLKVFAKNTGQQMTRYFSKVQRARRHFLFTLIKNDNTQRLFHSQKKQLAYFHALKRKRLLYKDNRRQNKRLAKALLNQLIALKGQLAHAEFEQYQQQIKRAYRQQDSFQLLELQRKISKNQA